MAILHADGFDHWGDNGQAVSGGVYIEHNSSLVLSGDAPRTGPRCCYIQNYGGGAGWLTKYVGGGAKTLGFGMAAIYNGYTNETMGFGFCDNDNQWTATLFITSSGSIRAYRDYRGTLFGETDPGVVALNSYAYIEAKLFCDNANGYIEIHVNGVRKLLVTNINTNGGNGVINSISWGKIQGGDNPYARYDDFVIWDTTTLFANDFLGDIRCRTRMAATNGPEQDWTPNNAPAWQEINRVPADPNNHFISTSNVGDVSDFGLDQLPTNTAYCAGVVAYYNVNKSDAGACEVTPGIISNGTVGAGQAISPGVGAAWYKSVYPVDPDTGTYWTLPALQAALARVERTI